MHVVPAGDGCGGRESEYFKTFFTNPATNLFQKRLHLSALVDGGLNVGAVPEDAPCRPAVLHGSEVEAVDRGRGRLRVKAEAGLLELRDQVQPDRHLVRAVVVRHARLGA